MDAELIWRVWRRILREPRLSEDLLEPGFLERAAAFGLSPEEARIAAAYAATPEGTRWAIETYRYRMESSALFTLEVGAPLTHVILKQLEPDPRKVSREYMEAIGWEDDGPFHYRACARYLDYLAKRLGARGLPGVREVIHLEASTVALIRSLAQAPASTWVAFEEREAPVDRLVQARFARTGTGVVVTMELTLTPWLQDPSQILSAPLEARPQHLLVYLPSAQEEHALASIGEMAKQIFELLALPRSYQELRDALADTGAGEALTDVLGRFLKMGVVRFT